MPTTETPRTITRDRAAELFEAKRDTDPGEWAFVADQHIRSTRWEDHYYLVVADADGVTYGLKYSEGRTEEQESTRPWEGDDSDDPLPLVRLYAHQVTTTVYRLDAAKAVTR